MNRGDFFWSLGLFGTAIGAGILFLPISAGIGGIAAIVFMAIFAFPMTYFAHRELAWFVLEGDSDKNIIDVADDVYGKSVGFLIAILYFTSIFSILIIYIISLANTVEAFSVTTLGVSAPSRVVLSAILVVSLLFLVNYGEEFVVRVMSLLVFPFILAILALSVYLIPKWSGGVFLTVHHSFWKEVLKPIIFVIPVMVFAFDHFPIISPMVTAQKKKYGKEAGGKINKILIVAHILMVIVVMFFVFSCAMTFTEFDFLKAESGNYTILSYIEEQFDEPIFRDLAPIIAIVAITKSFLGHYMGTIEGFLALAKRMFPKLGLSDGKLKMAGLFFIGLSCFLAAVYDPNVLNIIDTLTGPIIAILLFIVPSVAVLKSPKMEKYRGFATYFVLIFGILALSTIIVDMVRTL